MSSNKEFTLARALSRTLAALEHPEQMTLQERQELIEQSAHALSAFYSLNRRPALWDAGVFGRGAGWVVEFLPNGDSLETMAGCVTFEYKSEEGEIPKQAGAAMYFTLRPDPLSESNSKDTLSIAAVIGRFVETTLEAKGLKNWWPVQVEFREGWLISGPEIRGPSIIKLLDLENLPAL